MEEPVFKGVLDVSCALNSCRPGKRIGSQPFPAWLRQPINTLAQIDGLDSDQNAHLGRNPDHSDSRRMRVNEGRLRTPPSDGEECPGS